ncbi:MAG: hypothetical protein ACNS61_10605 [Candidatus Wenzhouxiangella sp. M2_3B_020]
MFGFAVPVTVLEPVDEPGRGDPAEEADQHEGQRLEDLDESFPAFGHRRIERSG